MAEPNTTNGPASTRPGTTFLAPRVRIRRLATILTAGREPGDDVPLVRRDVLRVEVTRVNTGASQFSITLNNWFDTLPSDRQDTSLANRDADQLIDKGHPLWPRYKYNNLVRLKFGDRLRIDMSYWPDLPQGTAPDATNPQTWIPMVAGPITDMSFSFTADQGAQVTISGSDDLSQLQDKNDGRREFAHLSEKTMVERVLQLANYPLSQIEKSDVEWPNFAQNDAQGSNDSLGDGQSYLDFLNKLADRLDFEVFIEFADLADADAGVTFHFEPARSLRPPDKDPKRTFVLRRDHNLLSFAPTIKVFDQYSAVKVIGRHSDRNRPERVVQPADPEVIDPELHIDPDQDGALLSGPRIRAKYFHGRPNEAQAPNQSNLDPERAKQLAVALLRKKAREFMTIDATTIGLPLLRPGHHVEVRGFQPPFDGFYYVTKTVHTYSSDGLRTHFNARRPGMPEPPYVRKPKPLPES